MGRSEPKRTAAGRAANAQGSKVLMEDRVQPEEEVCGLGERAGVGRAAALEASCSCTGVLGLHSRSDARNTLAAGCPTRKRRVSFHFLPSASSRPSLPRPCRAVHLRGEGTLAISPLLSTTQSVDPFWVTDPSWVLEKNTVYIFQII